MTHRFYRLDGTVEHHHVDRRPMQQFDNYEWHEDAGMPEIYLVLYHPELSFTLGNSELRSVKSVKRAFVRRNYHYGPDFIGPRRNCDYHEAT